MYKNKEIKMDKKRKTIFNGLDISGWYKAREILRERDNAKEASKQKKKISKE